VDAAIAVAPPGLLSSTIDWPRSAAIGSMMMRASTSAGPPAA
jgi:hypothetical protein